MNDMNSNAEIYIHISSLHIRDVNYIYNEFYIYIYINVDKYIYIYILMKNNSINYIF